MVEFGLIFVVVIVVLAWVYNFYNGANDCANAIATSVSTRALTPFQAVLLATILVFVGAFISTKVAHTIGRGIVTEEFMTPLVILSAILGAISWAAFATHKGMPVSITHSIVGGIIGAGITSHGIMSINWFNLKKIAIGMVTSPIAGFFGALILIIILYWVFKNFSPFKINFFFGKGQLLSASFMALSLGMNDAQNAMGVITIALVSGGFISEFHVPLWVMIGSAAFIGLGTFYGGKKVIKTMGMRIAKIKPVHGFAAQTAAGGVIFFSSLMGIPISTTHVISTAVMGVGSSKRFSAVRWGIAGNIIVAWLVTIPVTAIMAGLIYYLLNLIF